MKKITTHFVFIILFITGIAACGGDDKKSPRSNAEPKTVFDIAEQSDTFTTLVAALKASELDKVLDDPKARFTVFAPTDAAFALLGEDKIASLLADKDTLSDILLYHVISGSELKAADAIAAAGTTLVTANGDKLALRLNGGTLSVNLSVVSATDIVADNGVIHVIDAVLNPPAKKGEPTLNTLETAEAEGNFTTLIAALKAADLESTLTDPDKTFTVFAPTDAAFARLGQTNVESLLADPGKLAELLAQHLVAGALNSIDAYSLIGRKATTVADTEIPLALGRRNELRFGGAEIEVVDIHTSNGLIHVIDTVVVAGLELPKPAQNIVELAGDAGQFNTLITALNTAGLTNSLSDESSSFTVFAPTDAAFSALGQETISALLDDPEKLRDILLYHVVQDSTVLLDGASTVAASASPFITTANTNADNAALSFDGDNLLLNLSNIVSANVVASNGVIHVIDKVLLPPEVQEEAVDSIAEIVAKSSEFSTLAIALNAADLVENLNDESATFTVFAPTNAAFAQIDEAELNQLLGDVDALREVLGLHLVAGEKIDALSAYSFNGAGLTSSTGKSLHINIQNGQLKIENSTVVRSDIQATNGVIHVIDAVISKAAN